MEMSDKLKEQNHQESIEEPEQKRQKSNEDESEAEVIEPKAITNIYYDCLERIFDLLDLESLLMVADTCKRLQIAAAAKYGDEHGGKKIRLYPYAQEPMVIVGPNYIAVEGLKLCLAFLRCFGAKISDLAVRYYGLSYTTVEYLDEYINQYCANTLTSIEFCYKSQFSNEAFEEKPFKNVEKVKIAWCHPGNQLPNFVNWFPNLRNLIALNCLIDEHASMNVCFPHLEHLEFQIWGNENAFRIENAIPLLQANPQLVSSKISGPRELTVSTILDVISTNSLITKLVVENAHRTHMNVTVDELNRFAAEHPLVGELILLDYQLTADDAINFIRRMNELKRIEFQVKDRPECDRLLNQLDNEWKSVVSTDNGKFYIELKR